MGMKPEVNKRKRESGQSLVEFALIVPLLILIVLGIIEFGWIFNGKITTTSAAREGARVAAVPAGTDVRIKSAVDNHISGLSGFFFVENPNPDEGPLYKSKSDLDAASIPLNGVSAAVEYGQNAEGVKQVTVYVRGIMEPLVGILVRDEQELASRAIMRKEF